MTNKPKITRVKQPDKISGQTKNFQVGGLSYNTDLYLKKRDVSGSVYFKSKSEVKEAISILEALLENI